MCNQRTCRCWTRQWRNTAFPSKPIATDNARKINPCWVLELRQDFMIFHRGLLRCCCILGTTRAGDTSTKPTARSSRPDGGRRVGSGDLGRYSAMDCSRASHELAGVLPPPVMRICQGNRAIPSSHRSSRGWASRWKVRGCWYYSLTCWRWTKRLVGSRWTGARYRPALEYTRKIQSQTMQKLLAAWRQASA